MPSRAGEGRPSPLSLELGARGRELLGRRVERALELARRFGAQAVASLSLPVPPELDVSAAVLGARRPDDLFFCVEQPGRDDRALAGLGTAAVVQAEGPGRFADAADGVRALARRVLAGEGADDPGAPPGSGPVLVGGFAFAADGGATPEWSSFPPARLVLPEVSLSRLGDEARLTVNATVWPDDRPDEVVARAEERLEEMRPCGMPLLDPDLVGRPQVAGAAPPAHFEGAVARAVERIRAGELEKIVLAREVRVHTRSAVDAGPIVDALRTAFPDCFCFCVGTPGAAFVGASPELLVRREGSRVGTMALAGTTRRSADPAVDDHFGEQLRASAKDAEEHAIVARRIERRLEPVSLWVTAADEPVLVKVQNVQHLATPIRAQLARPRSAIELAGLLHPTPAVGGEPREAAEPLIPVLEGMDRGWYAGPVGWTDLSEDGEFCVALRCALLRDRVAHLYAGGGIVRDSDPAAELAETEVKLQALLPLFA
ncbi:MAG: isochorismate synthase [Actinomycetota bacterium]|nr:isochorismate synthase [Actinomycetota bacterium]MDQ3648083.1 isochorismate synthase [Actinomycetota bacterium]